MSSSGSATSAAKDAARHAARFRLGKGPFDLWHTHFDLEGHGRRSPRVRRLLLQSLFQAFDRALTQASRRRQVQIFVSLSRAEPEQDALYVHSPTRNGSPYPHQFDGFTPMRRVPTYLKDFIDPARFVVLHRRFHGGVWYVVTPR